MSEIEVREHEELVLPHSGEVVDLTDETACGVALDEIRRMQAHMAEATRLLSNAIAARAAVLGSKTIRLSGGRKAVVTGGTETSYDGPELMRRLRALGMPEDRIAEVVQEEVTHKVIAIEAKRIAAANPDYAKAVEAVRTVHEKPWSVQIRRR